MLEHSDKCGSFAKCRRRQLLWPLTVSLALVELHCTTTLLLSLLTLLLPMNRISYLTLNKNLVIKHRDQLP